jgi:predicted nucleic acid-binding protein
MNNKAHDLAAYNFTKGEPLLLDTNVWLFLFQAPSDSYLTPAPGYSEAFKKILSAGAQLAIDPIIIGEYLSQYCLIEFRALFQNRPYSNFKKFRRSPDFAGVGPKAVFFAKEILRLCSRHDYPFTKIDVAEMLLRVESGAMDVNDGLLVESCRHHGWKLVTHDGDCTQGGIEVLTTNCDLISSCP